MNLTEIPEKEWKFLANGAYGEVYRIDGPDGKKYAVKKLKMSSVRRDRDKRAIELEILKKASQRRIVPFYAFQELDFELRLYMGFMEMGSLSKYVLGKPLDTKKTRLFTSQILEGVSYLHSLSIIHRDIKGENILLEDEDNVRITNFGVSKVITELTNARSNTGTYNYRAPETFDPEPYDLKADIWSVGCTVVEMLTGGIPYGVMATTADLIELFNKGERPDHEMLLTPTLKHFLDKCFKIDPKERPSADKLLDSDEYLQESRRE